METMVYGKLPPSKKRLWQALLQKTGLEPDENVQRTVLIFDGETLAAAGSRQDNLLKCIAVDDAYQGQGLTGTLLTQLRQDAFEAGLHHLFLYTKPKNELQFSSLFFYPVAQTQQVLLMESKQKGISTFLDTLDAPPTRRPQRCGGDELQSLHQGSPIFDRNSRQAVRPAVCIRSFRG